MSADAITDVWWGPVDLTPAQKVVALAIAEVVNDAHDHMFWMHPGKLAKKVRMQPGNVRHRLGDLVDLGLLRVVERGGGKGKTTCYQWVLQPRRQDAESQNETASTESDTASTEHQTASTARERTSYIEKEEHKESEEPPTTAAEDFTTFWNAYPRPRNRADARRAWTKALKVATATEILTGLSAWLEDFRSMDIEFIPYPGTWLRQEGWANVSDETIRQRQTEARDAYWTRYTEDGL